MKKISPAILILLVVGTVFSIFAQADDEPINRFIAREIEHCRLETDESGNPYTAEKCQVWEVVIGKAYEFTLAPDMEEGYTRITLPIDTEASEDDLYIPRAKILCNDPEAIAVAKLNKETWQWEILSTSSIQEEGIANGQYRIDAAITSPGIYAIIEKDPYDTVRIKEVDPAGHTCQRITCGSYRGFETIPFTGNARQGENITLSFCNILQGCEASAQANSKEARACPQGVNSNNPSVCTSDEENSDCCVPARDDKCDPDCWKIDPEGNPIAGSPQKGQVVKDSTDPDCIIGDAELYNNDDLPDYGNEPIFSEIEVKTISQDNSRWTDNPYVKIYDPPKLFEGPIIVQISGSGTVFFKNFTYTDLEGKEHLLFPLYPGSGAFAVSPRHEEFNVKNTEKEGALWAEGVYFPHIWHQREEDNQIDGADRVQFDLPPTGIRKFSVYAIKNNEDVEKTTFTFKGTAYEGDADPDKDNSSNYDDCHDNNLYIYPGANEECNFIDDNCNGYRRYNESEEDETIPVGPWYSTSGGDCGDLPHEGPCDWCTYTRSYHYMMPCDGYLEFTNVEEGSYLEVWQKEACSIPGPTIIDETGQATPTWTAICPGPECPKTMGDYKTISCDAAGLNGPWNKYTAIFAKGDDISNIVEHTYSGVNYNTDGINIGCCFEFDNSDSYCDDSGCIIGAHASCKVGAMPDIPRNNEGKFYATDDSQVCVGTNYLGPDNDVNIFNQKGESLGGFGTLASTSSRDLNYEQNRVRLKEGDMIWAMVMDWGDGTDECGVIKFNVHCYKQEMNLCDAPNTSPAERKYVDEGLTKCISKTRKMDIYVCPAAKLAGDVVFIDDLGERRCNQDSLCPPQFGVDTGNISCFHEIAADENPGKKEFEVWVCPEGAKCFNFYKGNYNVCLPKEQCSGVLNPSLNLDLDCDGLTPFEEIKNEAGEVIGMDITKPKDPDCIGVELTGECDYTNRKWYKSETEGWVTEEYCQVCGDRDSSCAISCEPGQKSCGGGCLPDACDIKANRWCKNGVWTETDYDLKCGVNDSDSEKPCRANACDVEKDKICYADNWRATGAAGAAYCTLPQCKGKDASCRQPCTPGACDVDLNAYCRADGSWSADNAANYCSECGAIDADCGTKPCVSDTCDTVNKKVCVNEEWKESLVDYCGKCNLVDEAICLPSCPPEAEQTANELNCTDGKDNDCDGSADCRDRDDCGALPECLNACVPLSKDNCGPNEGICSPGERVCSMGGRWGECVGGRAPELEICNGFDDNCDGAVDEGCECTTGESRTCSSDRGVCRSGVQRCEEGKWGKCWLSSRQRSTAEECDGVDNDCDGDVDEGCPCIEGSNQSCEGTPGTICKAGMQVCTDGKWGACVGAVKPMKEDRNTGNTCSDSIDNDCDTKVDSADEGCSVTPADQITASCFDLKKNQDEEDIDCGGKCQPCSAPGKETCNNKKMDGDEEGRDCGGSCAIECPDNLRAREGPSEEETREETTEEPTCGDAYCDEEIGEDADTCPDDCAVDEGTSLTTFLIPAIIIIGLALGVFFAYKKGIIKLKGSKPEAKPAFPAPKGAAPSTAQPAFKMPPAAIKAAAQKVLPKKEIKTREELELEKSFNEEKELLKK